MRLSLSRLFLCLGRVCLIILGWISGTLTTDPMAFHHNQGIVKPNICLCIWYCEREKLFQNPGKLHVFRSGRKPLLALKQTTTLHPNDSVIRSIIAVIILFIWGRGAGWKRQAEAESSLPSFQSAFAWLICLFLMKRMKARTVERKRCQDWGRPPPSQGQTRGVNTWCPTLHINSAELITLIKQTHILSELRWPIAAS